MKKVLYLVVTILFGLMFTQAFAADDPAKAEALVAKGIEFYKAQGEEKALEEFSNSKGKFVDGSLYLFVVEYNGLTTAHGSGNASLIGKNMLGLKDADGKQFIQEMINQAKKGGGWVDYKWKDPKSGKVLPKSSYVKQISDSAFVGCGIYKEQ